MTISGMGFSGRAQNNGLVFVKLKDWKLRDRPDLKVKAVAGRAMGGVLADPQRHGLRLPAAGRRRTGHTPRGSISSCWTGAAWATPP